MKTSRLLFAFLFVSTLGASREARAQAMPTVTGIMSPVSRCQPGGGCSAADGGGANAIDLADCEGNLSYQFQLGISNPSSSYSLEAWAGTQDCTALANRQASATSVCWPVALFQPALTNPYVVNVRVQDIASGAFTAAHPVTYTPADPSICQSQPDAGTANVTLYFFFVDSAAHAVGAAQAYPITVDMGEAAAPDAGAGAAAAARSGGGCSAGGAGEPSGRSAFGMAMALAAAVVLGGGRRTARRR